MRLGLAHGYSGSHISINYELIQEAERLGYDSVWTAEAYGSDAITPLAYIGANTKKIRLGTAVMQMPGRSPANTAMTAMTLDQLSGGRFVLGLGTSGPQVVEGWHGVSYEKPLTWLREYITIVRKIFAREAPLEFSGERYQIPYKGPGSTGLGKPLKSIIHGRKDIPIYTASMQAKSQALSAELADGLILTCLDPTHFHLTEQHLNEGFARTGGTKSLANYDVTNNVAVIIGDDLDACRLPVKMQLALYIGGMGARGKNFYNEYASKIGFEEAAKKIQDAYLAGHKNDAIQAVPDALVDRLHLIGPKERIRDHYQAWKASKLGTMLVGTAQPEALRLMAELAAT
jgi:F420-dependent oxidoreductase-like protein